MKQACIYLDERLREKGLEHLKVGDIHDEAQHEIKDEATGHELGKLACQSIVDSGESFNMLVPMAGDYRIGRTWADTH